MNATSRTLFMANGRQLRILEAGQSDGVPVLFHSGTPGSRLPYHRAVEDARARGIRLICYDRPGYGGSTPQSARAVAQAPNDVAAIARELGIERLLILGHSGGGPHALACAALLPGLVVAAAVVGSPAPYGADGLDWFAGMGEDNAAEFQLALQGRHALEPFVEAAASGLLDIDPPTLIQAFQSLLSPVDSAALTVDFAEFLLDHFRGGIRERRDGWIDDDIALTTPWGFDVSQIHIPVMLLHGEQDHFVSFSHGQWLASKIPTVDARLLAGEGHLSLLAGRIGEVHEWLLSHKLLD